MIDRLLGKTFWAVTKTDDELRFMCDDGTFVFSHSQSCCESVYIESVVGDLQDLVGSPMLRAEEGTQDDTHATECGLWTFYKFATRNGYVDVRWYGSSNGYYGVGVDIDFLPKE